MRGGQSDGEEAAAAISTPTSTTSVTSLKPRQILLLSMQSMRQNATAVATDGGVISLTSDSKSLLLNSICQFLERNGLSKTLKKLRSEAQIESDDSRSCLLNLEEMCYKYLKMRHVNADNQKKIKGQGKSSEAILEDNEGTCSGASMENVLKKKKKKKTSGDSDERNCEGSGQQQDSVKMFVELSKDNEVDNAKAKSKEKKKSKSADDFHGENIEESPGKETLNVPSEVTRKSKDKKKKSELSSASQNDSQPKQEQAPTSVTSIPGKSATETELSKKSKSEGKKQKSHKKCDSLDDSIKECSLEDKQGTSMTDLVGKQYPRDSQLVISLEKADDIPLEKNKVKLKGKRAKDTPVSDDLSVGAMEALDQEENIIKGDLPTAEGKNIEEKKGSKKRKNFSSEANQNGHVEISSKDSKRRKTDGSGEGRAGESGAKVQMFVVADGEVLKGQNGQVNSSTLQTLSANKDADGALVKNGGDKSSMQKHEKNQHNGSAELRKISAFQRVKADGVVFADNRLQDNSYWAKDGAESGYGAKAQEVLGQVRGRDFRHQKTKKKRGSYRGGQIDVQSHSVKFNYSDDE